jgi:hypothetical protein
MVLKKPHPFKETKPCLPFKAWVGMVPKKPHLAFLFTPLFSKGLLFKKQQVGLVSLAFFAFKESKPRKRKKRIKERINKKV